MRKMRSILLFVAAVVLVMTAMSCEKKPTEPEIIPIEMIFVPSGTFTMGNTRDEDYWSDLPHTVTLNSFYISKYEVTQAEYSKYMQPTEPWISLYGLGDNYPAYAVSWYAAIKYCNLRSMAEGLTPCYTIEGSVKPFDWGPVPTEVNNATWGTVYCNFSADGYRLPTEAEWEYAARGAGNNPDYLYSGSNDIDAVAWNNDEEDYDDGYTNWGTHPVGGKAPNGLGIYDMSGNVEEWCWDWYRSDYYSNSTQDNPTGPGSGWGRVLRGGSWYSYVDGCRVSSRGYDEPYCGDIFLGFRLCRSRKSNTVLTPSFFPPGGSYTLAQDVQISCETGGAIIHYTTDGSEPTLSSPIYSGPINVSSTTTIKAKGFKDGWTPSATATATYTITPIQMVYVHSGTFSMGNTRGVVDDDGSEYDDELPTHAVSLGSFYIGKYEVTQAEYSQYMQPCSFWEAKYGLGDHYPAYNVSWYAAIKYCNLRSIAEGLNPCYTIAGSTNPADWGYLPTDNNAIWDAAVCNFSTNGYRLPTEAEWEYAARGATILPDYLYSGSDDFDAVAWCYENSGDNSNPVGTKAPNGIGIFDMSGNVNEWCWDWYDESYYNSGPHNNPTGPLTGLGRLLRGGDWYNGATNCRVSRRTNSSATWYNQSVGFRLCRSKID